MRKMQSAKLILLTATLSLAASCASYRVELPAEGCSSLAESILGRPTEHAQLQQSADPLLDWQLYGAAETGQLNVANNDKVDGFSIVKKCEDRDRKAYRKATAAWWQFWR